MSFMEILTTVMAGTMGILLGAVVVALTLTAIIYIVALIATPVTRKS